MSEARIAEFPSCHFLITFHNLFYIYCGEERVKLSQNQIYIVVRKEC